jgi:glycosyltransferase involved in cell wall biosynthesis
MMFPRVTVVISAFNSEKWLRACIGQLQGQSIVDALEIIIIDSGSEQDERSVCGEFSALLPRLIYERTERETLYAAWNRALAKASGKYFVNANTDDSLHPEAFQLLTKALEENPDAALAYGDWVWVTVPNAIYPWNSSFRRCVHPEYHPSLALFYAYAGCHQFWRTDKLRELGGFNAEYKAAGDYDALCRLALKRWKAVYVPEAVSAFYQNPDGLSRSSDVSYREFLEIRDRFRSAFSIEDLYDVDPADRRACAAAWVDLGHRALKLRVPWAEENTPDMQFAEVCARRALGLEPANADAARMLQRAAPASTGFWSSLRKMIAPTGAAVSARS